MRVITNTTPLRYLVFIACVDILPALFGQVIVPQIVIQKELQHPRTPERVRTWAAKPPGWLEVRQSIAIDATLENIHAGERDAILLAQELQADLLLMDDWGGRQEAERRGFSVKGTLWAVEEAAQKGLIALPTVLSLLQATSFHMPQALLQDMLERDKVWKASQL